MDCTVPWQGCQAGIGPKGVANQGLQVVKASLVALPVGELNGSSQLLQPPSHSSGVVVGFPQI